LITHGTNEQIYGMVLTYRLSVHGPEDLCRLLPIVYFDESKGIPPNAPMYRSEFSVQDALDGKAGWSDEEIAEFHDWLRSDASLSEWAAEIYQEVDKAIRESPLWDSEFITGEPENGSDH